MSCFTYDRSSGEVSDIAAFWVTLVLAGLVLAFALLTWWRPADVAKFDDKQLRAYRMHLEGRAGFPPAGKYILVGLGIFWLVVAVDHIVRGSGRGLLYLTPGLALFVGLWVMRWRKRVDLATLGGRGYVPRSDNEVVAEIWYRLWGTVLVVGIFGPQMVEYFSERTFSENELFADPVSTVHTLLTLATLAGFLGLGITYLNTREKDSTSATQASKDDSERGV